MKPFESSSYLTQVKRLRALAIEALKRYPIKKYELKFINHGENTTYQVISGSKSYLLRLHRENYHSKNAVIEELNWLKQLSRNSEIQVQKPIFSKKRNLVETCSIEGAPKRHCDLLEWQEGQIRFEGLTTDSFYQVGLLLGKLHLSTKKVKVKHRRYWTAEGLLGKKAKLGSLDALKETLSSNDFKSLISIRNRVLRRIKSYQKPSVMGLIHADLHFGNMLWNHGVVIPIDFDDCGYGFYLADLAIPFYHSQLLYQKKGKKFAAHSKALLLEGYSQSMSLTQKEIDLLPYFVLARKMGMYAWLYNRSDNPRIHEIFLEKKKKRLSEIKKDYRNLTH